VYIAWESGVPVFELRITSRSSWEFVEQFGKMMRRNTRLRREYLYRKSLEGTERQLYEKKLKIRQSLAGVFVWLTSGF
jgi:hypothetical protein